MASDNDQQWLEAAARREDEHGGFPGVFGGRAPPAQAGNYRAAAGARAMTKPTIPSTIIRDDKIDNLRISEDTGDEDKPIAVMLYTPNMAITRDHHHIELNADQAQVAYEWLGAFLAKLGIERLP